MNEAGHLMTVDARLVGCCIREIDDDDDAEYEAGSGSFKRRRTGPTLRTNGRKLAQTIMRALWRAAAIVVRVHSHTSRLLFALSLFVALPVPVPVPLALALALPVAGWVGPRQFTCDWGIGLNSAN